MALNINQLQTAFVRTLNELVGKDADPSRQLFTSPVIKARKGGTRPDYPYVVVDKTSFSNYGLNGVYSEGINDDGFFERRTNYKVPIVIVVHGGSEDDVQMIAQEIRDTLNREYGRQKLYEEFDAGLLYITPPSFSSSFLHTDYEEVSRMVVELSVTDVFVEDNPNIPSTDVIDNIFVDGVVEDREESSNEINIDVP